MFINFMLNYKNMNLICIIAFIFQIFKKKWFSKVHVHVYRSFQLLVDLTILPYLENWALITDDASIFKLPGQLNANETLT